MVNQKLLKLFENKEKPGIVLQYIYDNVYELIKEMNDYSNPVDKKRFLNAYKDYYCELVNNITDKSILYYFPNLDYSHHYSYYYDFRNFFAGIVGRILCNTEYCYGDPMNWELAYHLDPIGKNVCIRKYTLLETYDGFKIYDVYWAEFDLFIADKPIIYRTISETSKINWNAVQYKPLDVISRLEWRKNSFYFFFDRRIDALLHNIYERRRDEYEIGRGYNVKPLYRYVYILEAKLKEF